MDIIIYIISFILGVICTLIVEHYILKIFRKSKDKVLEIKKKHRFGLLTSKNINDWLINYYRNKNMDKYIYNARIGNTTKPIPFLTKDNWYGINARNLQITLSEPFKISDYKVDNKLIQKRLKLGHNLWNDNIFTAYRIVENNNSLKITLGLCEYYQYLSFSGKLEDETIKSKSGFRNNVLSAYNHFCDSSKNVSGLGMACLIAVKSDNTYKILLQVRSGETVNNAGKYAVIPAGAYQSMHGDYENEKNFEYQILREYYEELFNQEELIKRNKHLSFDWFYDHPPVLMLKTLLNNNKAKIIPLGIGIDALNGEPNIAFLMLINDENFLNKIKQKIIFSWESNLIIEKNIDDAFFEKNLSEGNFTNGSAFAISESIKHIKGLNIPQN